MASMLPQCNPVSDTDRRYGMTTDEKKRKRMTSNRDSARRSRMKKQKQLEDLTKEANHLKDENGKLAESIEACQQRYAEIESQNNVLRAQALELTERLKSMNTVLRCIEEVHRLNLDIPDEPNALLNPSQIRCSTQPIATSAHNFRR